MQLDEQQVVWPGFLSVGTALLHIIIKKLLHLTPTHVALCDMPPAIQQSFYYMRCEYIIWYT